MMDRRPKITVEIEPYVEPEEESFPCAICGSAVPGWFAGKCTDIAICIECTPQGLVYPRFRGVNIEGCVASGVLVPLMHASAALWNLEKEIG